MILVEHFVGQEGHLHVARWLLTMDDKQVTACNINGTQPIHLVCRDGHLAVAKWLIDQGASVHAPGNAGTQPIHDACYHGQLALVQCRGHCVVGAGEDALLVQEELRVGTALQRTGTYLYLFTAIASTSKN